MRSLMCRKRKIKSGAGSEKARTELLNNFETKKPLLAGSSRGLLLSESLIGTLLHLGENDDQGVERK